MTNKRLAEAHINVLNSFEAFARNHSGFEKLKTTDDCWKELTQLKKFSESLDDTEKAIRFNGLFSLEDQQKHLEQARNIKELFNYMQVGIENQAKSRGIELYFY